MTLPCCRLASFLGSLAVLALLPPASTLTIICTRLPTRFSRYLAPSQGVSQSAFSPPTIYRVLFFFRCANSPHNAHETSHLNLSHLFIPRSTNRTLDCRTDLLELDHDTYSGNSGLITDSTRSTSTIFPNASPKDSLRSLNLSTQRKFEDGISLLVWRAAEAENAISLTTRAGPTDIYQRH